MDEQINIGDRIRLARVSRKWSQEYLAQKINKTRALISHIEKTGQVHAETLRVILQCFNMDEKQLLSITNEPIADYQSATTVLKEEVKDLQLELERLRNQIQVQEELIASQRRIISLIDKAAAKKEKGSSKK